ncbi:MAG: hypothetical protein NTU49_00895 [Gammaproteobacteria bacterium]|nr:hypothetical protein [Gammaproteobacteria bacterium]
MHQERLDRLDSALKAIKKIAGKYNAIMKNFQGLYWISPVTRVNAFEKGRTFKGELDEVVAILKEFQKKAEIIVNYEFLNKKVNEYNEKLNFFILFLRDLSENEKSLRSIEEDRETFSPPKEIINKISEKKNSSFSKNPNSDSRNSDFAFFLCIITFFLIHVSMKIIDYLLPKNYALPKLKVLSYLDRRLSDFALFSSEKPKESVRNNTDALSPKKTN